MPGWWSADDAVTLRRRAARGRAAGIRVDRHRHAGAADVPPAAAGALHACRSAQLARAQPRPARRRARRCAASAARASAPPGSRRWTFAEPTLGDRAARRRAAGARVDPGMQDLERVPGRARPPSTAAARASSSCPRRAADPEDRSPCPPLACPHPELPALGAPGRRSRHRHDRHARRRPAGVVDLNAAISVNGTPTPPMPVRLRGPADVVGIDANQVVRTDPQPGTSDFEPNCFPCVEFDRADFPWLFTPASAGAEREAAALAVPGGGAQAGRRHARPPRPTRRCRSCRSPRRRCRRASCPISRECWAWAHAQAAGDDSTRGERCAPRSTDRRSCRSRA